MKSDVDAAIAAINLDESDRDKARDSLLRLSDMLAAAFQGKTPRLERTLPDVSVENYPVALQIWSLGDKEVYFVGCLIRPHGTNVQIYIQAHPFVNEVVRQLQGQLKAG